MAGRSEIYSNWNSFIEKLNVKYGDPEDIHHKTRFSRLEETFPKLQDRIKQALSEDLVPVIEGFADSYCRLYKAFPEVKDTVSECFAEIYCSFRMNELKEVKDTVWDFFCNKAKYPIEVNAEGVIRGSLRQAMIQVFKRLPADLESLCSSLHRISYDGDPIFPLADLNLMFDEAGLDPSRSYIYLSHRPEWVKVINEGDYINLLKHIPEKKTSFGAAIESRYLRQFFTSAFDIFFYAYRDNYFRDILPALEQRLSAIAVCAGELDKPALFELAHFMHDVYRRIEGIGSERVREIFWAAFSATRSDFAMQVDAYLFAHALNDTIFDRDKSGWSPDASIALLKEVVQPERAHLKKHLQERSGVLSSDRFIHFDDVILLRKLLEAQLTLPHEKQVLLLDAITNAFGKKLARGEEWGLVRNNALCFYPGDRDMSHRVHIADFNLK